MLNHDECQEDLYPVPTSVTDQAAADRLSVSSILPLNDDDDDGNEVSASP